MTLITPGKAVTLCGDALTILRTLPAESVHTCVTSPPYFGLRKYLKDGQEDADKEIGTEDTPASYVARLVQVFAEVRRVLRDDGTLWLNLGDSYSSGKMKTPDNANGDLMFNDTQSSSRAPGLPPKNLLGIPWRVAFALQEAGWILRQEIIWHKPDAMPSSVVDRPTSDHEKIFLMAKSPRYFYDWEAIAEPVKKGSCGSKFYTGKTLVHQNGNTSRKEREEKPFKNKRAVWSVPTGSFLDAHFATYPAALITPCIMAGCPEGGTVLDCFAGSGTTLATAITLGRNAIGIELNPEYVCLIEKRVARAQALSSLGLFEEEETETPAESREPLTLF